MRSQVDEIPLARNEIPASGQPVLYATQRLFDEETRSEPSHRSKARKTESKLPIFLEFSQGKLGWETDGEYRTFYDLPFRKIIGK